MRGDAPPALARRLLRALLPEGLRTSALLGDLEELWRERRAARGRIRADLWYVGQAMVAVWKYRMNGDDVRTGGEVVQDVTSGIRSVLRRLRRARAHSAAVVGTLALGVGANTAVFSLISGVLLEPLPYPDASRIALVYEDNDGIDMPAGFATVPNYLDWRDRSTSFESLALFRGRSVAITTDVIPEYAYGALVSPEFFDVFGTEPALGRRFVPDDSRPGAPPVVILSHGLWTRGFGADPGLIGRTVRVDGAPHAVVGIMPAGFEAHGDWVGTPVQLWRPFPITDDVMQQGRSFHVAGRLADGVDLPAARSEMTALAGELAELRPEENADWYVRLDRYRDMVVGGAAPALWLMLAATALLLAIACANVANLSLNRVLDRGRELATRRALGASRGSVVGLALGESAVLALGGGAVGLLVARGLVAGVRAAAPDWMPRLAEVGLDGRVFAYAFGLVVLTALTFGAAAGIAAARSAPGGVLRSSRGTGATWNRARNALLAGQLAVTFALMLTAGLLARSFEGLRTVDLGFDADGVTAASVALSWERVSTIQERTRFSSAVLTELRAIPGVVSAGMINSLPLSGSDASQPVEIDGAAEGERAPVLAMRGISPGYLETLGIRLVSGRDLRDEDVDDPSVVLVNEAAADRYWPDGDPVGRLVRPSGSDAWSTVVGVVGDVRHYGPDRPARPELYTPYSAEFLTSKTFVVRWAGAERASPELVREAILAVDPEQPVREVRAMTDWVARATSGPRFQSSAMALAALLATCLAVIGLFGVLSGLVRARAPELALRVAVGASPGQVLWLVVARAGWLALVGVLGGVALALLAGNVLRGFLVGVSAHDPVVMGGAIGLFVVVAALTALLPARRATSLDPARILNQE